MTARALPQTIDFTPREYAEFAIRHKGKDLNLHMRPWLSHIYDMPVIRRHDGSVRRKMLLIFGRQCEKSTTIANLFIALCNTIEYLRSLYVTASHEQMREFSDERLRAVIADSPILLKMIGVVGAADRQTQNVQTKRWVTQAKIVLRSVYKSPDRVRGIASDLLGVDELQDIILDFLPVIEETLFACEIEDGPFSIYSGTPKTFENPLELYWSLHSTQNEWAVRCERCGHWSIIEEENIGPVGLVCMYKFHNETRCGGLLDPIRNGQWVRTGKADAEWEGFRLPQPIAIYARMDKPLVFRRQWSALLVKQGRYSRAKFLNEVMARSYDLGTKPVSLAEVRRCCLQDYSLVYEPTRHMKSTYTWAGVDWGTGDESYTVLSIWTYDIKGRFRCLFAKRYEGLESDPDYSVMDIIKWCRVFNVTRIGADWGFGFYPNSKLQKAFGADKVMLYMHAGKQKDKVRWNKEGGHFTTHRTRVLQDVFTLIKRGPRALGIAFANWEEMEPFIRDILVVYSEYSERMNELKFDHPRGRPDDFLHTVCYALLASQWEHRRPDLHAPGSGKKSK